MRVIDAMKQYALDLLKENQKERENESYITPDSIKNELEQKRKSIETILGITIKRQ